MWRLELLNLQLLSLGLGGLGLGTGWLFEGVLQDLYTSLSVGLSSSLSNSAWHAWHACWASPAGTLFLDWVSDHRVKLRHISSYKIQRVQLQLVVTTPCETHELQRSALRKLSLFFVLFGHPPAGNYFYPLLAWLDRDWNGRTSGNYKWTICDWEFGRVCQYKNIVQRCNFSPGFQVVINAGQVLSVIFLVRTSAKAEEACNTVWCPCAERLLRYSNGTISRLRATLEKIDEIWLQCLGYMNYIHKWFTCM